MSFPPNEFPERAPGCCTEGGSMVPLPGGRLAASQHYAKETRTSSFIFVLSHERTGGTKRKNKKEINKWITVLCSSEKSSLTFLWGQTLLMEWEEGHTEQFSRWVTPLFSVLPHHHPAPCFASMSKKMSVCFYCFCSMVCGLCRRQKHPSGTALSAVWSFFIRLSVIIHFWVTVLDQTTSSLAFADSCQSQTIFTLALFFTGSQWKTTTTPLCPKYDSCWHRPSDVRLFIMVWEG